MVDYIHQDTVIDVNTTKADAMATVKVVDSDDTPRGASSFTLNGLKSHLVHNLLVKKPKVVAPLATPQSLPYLPGISHTHIKIYTGSMLLK
jgi:hypothetical protein